MLRSIRSDHPANRLCLHWRDDRTRIVLCVTRGQIISPSHVYHYASCAGYFIAVPGVGSIDRQVIPCRLAKVKLPDCVSVPPPATTDLVGCDSGTDSYIMCIADGNRVGIIIRCQCSRTDYARREIRYW